MQFLFLAIWEDFLTICLSFPFSVINLGNPECLHSSLLDEFYLDFSQAFGDFFFANMSISYKWASLFFKFILLTYS